jgi:hypothetical protein
MPGTNNSKCLALTLGGLGKCLSPVLSGSSRKGKYSKWQALVKARGVSKCPALTLGCMSRTANFSKCLALILRCMGRMEKLGRKLHLLSLSRF